MRHFFEKYSYIRTVVVVGIIIVVVAKVVSELRSLFVGYSCCCAVSFKFEFTFIRVKGFSDATQENQHRRKGRESEKMKICKMIIIFFSPGAQITHSTPAVHSLLIHCKGCSTDFSKVEKYLFKICTRVVFIGIVINKKNSSEQKKTSSLNK